LIGKKTTTKKEINKHTYTHKHTHTQTQTHKHRQDSVTLFKCALFLENQGKFEQAEEFFLKSLEFNPSSVAVLMKYAG